MCLNPLTLRVPSTTFQCDIPIFAPCGKCIECVVERQNGYKLRLCYEARRWNHCFFFTLTYNNAALPKVLNKVTGEVVSTCCKDHVRSWIKVMRERYLRSRGSRFDFRYFICSEYGSTDEYVDDRGCVRKATGRPHYHGIIFCNDSPEFLNEMFDEWRRTFGRVDADELKPTKKCPDIREHRSKVANYVSKYCCKGEFSSRVDDIESGSIEPSWFILSNGIGSNYVDDMKSYHLMQDGLFSVKIQSFLPEGAFTIDGVSDWFKSRKGTSREAHASMLWEYVNDVVDRMYVLDGDHKYRMPRYFRSKIYGTQKSVKRLRKCGFTLKLCYQSFSESEIYGRFVQAPKPFLWDVEEYEVKVPSSENFLSCAIAFVLRSRFDIESQRDFAEYVLQNFGKLPSIIISGYEKRRLAIQKNRANIKRARLKNFYYKNHLDNPELSI